MACILLASMCMKWCFISRPRGTYLDCGFCVVAVERSYLRPILSKDLSSPLAVRLCFLRPVELVWLLCVPHSVRCPHVRHRSAHISKCPIKCCISYCRCLAFAAALNKFSVRQPTSAGRSPRRVRHTCKCAPLSTRLRANKCYWTNLISSSCLRNGNMARGRS